MATKSVPARSYSLDQPHPLSGHVASTAEEIALLGIELSTKLAKLLDGVRALQKEDENGLVVLGLLDIADELVGDSHNTFDCERECHRDAVKARLAQGRE